MAIDRTITVYNYGGKVGASDETPRVRRGDTVKFFAADGSDGVALDDFRSSMWTSTGYVTLSSGRSITRTVQSDAPLGSSASSTIAIEPFFGGQATYIQFEVEDNLDIKPDQFRISNHTNAIPNDVYVTSFKVTGVNGSPQFKITGPGVKRIARDNSGGGSTYETAGNGRRIYVFIKTPSGYGQRHDYKIEAEGVSDTFYVQTRSSPAIQNREDIGVSSGWMRLSKVKQFHGGNGRLSTYNRGGPNIPDTLSDNNDIGRSVPISLGSIRNSDRAFYFIDTPDGCLLYKRVSQKAGELNWQFDIRNYTKLAWGDYANSDIDYRYELATDKKTVNTLELRTLNGKNPRSWSTGNTKPRVRAVAGHLQYGMAYGRLFVYARDRLGRVASCTVRVCFLFGASSD